MYGCKFNCGTELTSVQFANVQQKVLNVLIGKAGIFGLVPSVGAPIASRLKELEEGIDVSKSLLSDYNIYARVADIIV
jgi:hypothetical protein